MKKTKRHSRTSYSYYLALAALFVSLLINRIYLRYRPLPIRENESVEEGMSTVPVQNKVDKTIYPSLTINKINLTIPIYSARVVEGKWQTTTKGLSHASSTPLPGELGNVVIYGHNWPNMLKNLPTLIPGDLIEVKLSDNRQVAYSVTYTTTISPTDTSLTRNTNDSRLTLYTCTGLFDQNRFVVVAHLL